MPYVEVGECRIFKSTLVRQLIGNPNLFKYQLAWNKVAILYMKPEFLCCRQAQHYVKLWL